jgi:prepilin-type N-terminal cleavage/methylation domain-containing protein
MRARLRSEAGFSLVELLTTMILMGILLPALALMLTTTIHWTSESQEESSLQTEARAALDRMTSEIRQAYSGDTSWPITAISSTSITFLTPDRSVPAADGSDPFHVVKVQYQLTGGKLQRASWTSTNTTPSLTAPTWTFPNTPVKWITVLGSVKNASLFTFKDVNGTTITTPASAVREVDVNVSVAPNISQGRQFTYQSTATPRLEP